MSGKLKVYGGNSYVTGDQRRCVAAVTNQKQFADLIGESLNYVRDFCCETGNSKELGIAFSSIGDLFVECGECRHYHKWEKNGNGS